MINYETSNFNSPFYLANKNYIETVVSELTSLNFDCKGFCNGFGYDIEATLKRNSLIFNLKFHKHHGTQDGGMIPMDAIVHEDTELKVFGLNKQLRMTFGKSKIRRFFTTEKFKGKIPAPFFIKFNFSPDSILFNNIVKLMMNYNFSKIKLNNGKIVCKARFAIIDILDLISDTEKVIKSGLADGNVSKSHL